MMILNSWALYTVLRDLKRTKTELDRLVRNRLKNILISAFKNVPFYKQQMKIIGYDPIKDFQGPSDLQHFPIISRDALKKEGFSAFLNQNLDTSQLHTSQSSGSSGRPIKVWREPWARSLQVACWLRTLRENGYGFRDKLLAVSDPSRLGSESMFLQRLGLFRRWVEDLLIEPEKLVDIIFQLKPDVIYGTRSTFDLCAFEMEKRQVEVDWMKLIMIGGEVIHEKNRHACMSNFGIQPTEYYGTVESGILGYETPERNGLKLCEDLILYEFLDEKDNPLDPGETGRLIITRLSGKAMPLIRYDVGDLLTYNQIVNSQGEVEKRITSVTGRENDFLTLTDGTQLPYYYFTTILYNCFDLKQFRIIQEKPDFFRILIVGDEDYCDMIVNGLKSKFNELLNPLSSYEIERVSEIPIDRSGKFRAVISFEELQESKSGLLR